MKLFDALTCVPTLLSKLADKLFLLGPRIEENVVATYQRIIFRQLGIVGSNSVVAGLKTLIPAVVIVPQALTEIRNRIAIKKEIHGVARIASNGAFEAKRRSLQNEAPDIRIDCLGLGMKRPKEQKHTQKLFFHSPILQPAPIHQAAESHNAHGYAPGIRGLL